MRGASKAVSFSRGTKGGGAASDPGWQMAEAARLRMQLVLVISAARVPTHVRDLLREEPRAKPKAKGR